MGGLCSFDRNSESSRSRIVGSKSLLCSGVLVDSVCWHCIEPRSVYEDYIFRMVHPNVYFWFFRALCVRLPKYGSSGQILKSAIYIYFCFKLKDVLHFNLMYLLHFNPNATSFLWGRNLYFFYNESNLSIIHHGELPELSLILNR